MRAGQEFAEAGVLIKRFRRLKPTLKSKGERDPRVTLRYARSPWAKLCRRSAARWRKHPRWLCAELAY